VFLTLFFYLTVMTGRGSSSGFILMTFYCLSASICITKPFMERDMWIKGLNVQTPLCQLVIDDWHIRPGEHWGIFMAHAHSCHLLLRLFSREQGAGELDIKSRVCFELPDSIAIVSLSEQQKLLEQEIARDETDFQDHIDYGTTVENLVLEAGCAPQRLEELLLSVDLVALRQRGFRQLSTGETRRLMLARALAAEPEMLVLHEPYSGLDTAHREAIKTLLERISSYTQLLVITSRTEELTDCTTHVALFDAQRLTQTLSYADWLNHPVVEQLTALSATKPEIWLNLSRQYASEVEFPEPRVRLNQVCVEYTDGIVFRNLSWQVHANQHWQIRGPNGCGKSTLLGLIMGDHPQCYSNDIYVLGHQRGSGESIWEIKRHIGIVSSALHLQYRVNCSALEVLLSGFFDSIGVYQRPSAKQYQVARHWLSVLEMDPYEKHSFRELDYGQQRLLLIARALIKRPALLILDEPYQGLDYLNRCLVMTVLNQLAQTHVTQLLYVSHYAEDSLEAIQNYVDFIPDPAGGYRAQVTRVDA
jgi:molybdate transport system ATP-binding protein